jgi:polyhydroxyalkanoate synthesis regulator phasin
MPVEKQVMSIYAVTNGYLDDIPVEDAKRFEQELLEFMETRHSEVGEHIAEKGDLPEEMEGKLKEALEEFGKLFQPSEEKAGAPEAQGGPVDKLREDVGWERVGEEVRPESPEGEEALEEVEREGGPAGDAKAPPPG